jgi:hypothetical protein
MQITKVFSKQFSVYLGGENLTDYTQKNAILAYNDPFSPYFDSSMIYAPVHGRTFYAGLRFKVFKKKEEHHHEEGEEHHDGD